MKNIFEIISTIVVAGVALAVAHAYFQDRAGGTVPDTIESSRMVSDWEERSQGGLRRGPGNASVVITEFVDFQCPFCARLVPTLDSILAAFPKDVALVVHHFPLSMHEHAMASAIVAECAHRQGRFWPMYEILLSGQDRMGVESWESFAKDAQVPNRPQFSECINLPSDSFPRIDHGRSLGRSTGVTGTPTTWVNGRVIRPTTDMIRELLDEGIR